MRGRAWFESLLAELGADPGAKNMPEGYHVTDGEMVAEFYAWAKDLAITGVSEIVESQFGYHIIRRLALDKTFFDENKDSIATAIYEQLFDDIVEDVADIIEVVKNDKFSIVTVANSGTFA